MQELQQNVQPKMHGTNKPMSGSGRLPFLDKAASCFLFNDSSCWNSKHNVHRKVVWWFCTPCKCNGNTHLSMGSCCSPSHCNDQPARCTCSTPSIVGPRILRSGWVSATHPQAPHKLGGKRVSPPMAKDSGEEKMLSESSAHRSMSKKL